MGFLHTDQHAMSALPTLPTYTTFIPPRPHTLCHFINDTYDFFCLHSLYSLAFFFFYLYNKAFFKRVYSPYFHDFSRNYIILKYIIAGSLLCSFTNTLVGWHLLQENCDPNFFATITPPPLPARFDLLYSNFFPSILAPGKNYTIIYFPSAL
jgi:hypothetical protein